MNLIDRMAIAADFQQLRLALIVNELRQVRRAVAEL